MFYVILFYNFEDFRAKNKKKFCLKNDTVHNSLQKKESLFDLFV